MPRSDWGGAGGSDRCGARRHSAPELSRAGASAPPRRSCGRIGASCDRGALGHLVRHRESVDPFLGAPARDRRGERPMSEAGTPKGASVVVVGAGVTGLSAAWWLARSGIDVLVVDKGVVGWEASGRK